MSYNGFIVEKPSKEFLVRVKKIIDLMERGYCSNAMKCVRIGRVGSWGADNAINGIDEAAVDDPRSFYGLGTRFVDEKDVTDELIYQTLGLPYEKPIEKPVEKPKGQRIWGIKDISFGQVFAAFSTRAEARNQARCDSDFKVVRGRFIED
jgi:hypothetical protein